MLRELYYDPKTGFTGIQELQRKSGLPTGIVKKWLHEQDTYTLHKPVQKNFPTRRVWVSGIDDQWQADLVDMIKWKHLNKGYQHILTVIDCFSKYAWAIPIKNKSGDEIVLAFKKIFSERKPSMIQTDAGTEFIGKKTQELFKKMDIHWFATNSEKKASIVERLNRTLKTKMWKYFTDVGNKVWVDVLNDLVYNYHHSFHRSIKMTPVEASKKENENKVFLNLFPNVDQTLRKPKFNIGDKVRIAKWKHSLHKGYLPNWTMEIFTVTDVKYTNPVTYKIADFDDEPVEGSFYEQELVRFDKQDKDYEIEKIVKQRRKGGKKQFLVKWKGYPENMNSWVNEENLNL